MSSSLGQSRLARYDASYRDVVAFDRFYEENKQRLKMPPSDTYPRNEDAIAAMCRDVAAFGSRNDVMLAGVIASSVQHIDFNRFYQTLMRTAYEVVAKCEREDRAIHLLVDGSLMKSNVWCALLIWPVVKSRVVSISSPDALDLAEYRSAQKLCVVHVDDAAYSGMQLRNALDDARIDDIDASGGDNSRVVWVIVLAAATREAKQRLERRSPIVSVVGSNLIAIPTLRESALAALGVREDDDEQALYNLTSGQWANFVTYSVGLDMSCTMAYFDHKMPDAVSTNNALIAFAPTPARGNVASADPPTVHALVLRCPSEKQTTYAQTGGFDYDQDEACPSAFYKSIAYTINGVDTDLWPGTNERGMKKRLTIERVLQAVNSGVIDTATLIND